MRKYLLFILFISMSFGQDVLTTKEGTEYKGKMIEAGHYEIKFKGEGMLSPQNVNIEKIKSLILSDGTEVVKDGFLVKRDLIIKEDHFRKMKDFKLSDFGGTLIGISGIVLYLNNQRTSDENSSEEERENFADKSKSNADLAYVLLTIGGALIAISK